MGQYSETRKHQQTEVTLGDFKQALAFHLARYGGACNVQVLDEFIVDSARSSKNRQAYIKVAVDDAMVKELRGTLNRHALLLVDLPMSTVIEFAQKRTGGGKRVITPNQAGMSPTEILSSSNKLAERIAK